MHTSCLPETLTTEQLAAALQVRAASIRSYLCKHGHYAGVKPIKLCNRLLRWPKDSVAQVLRGEPTS